MTTPAYGFGAWGAQIAAARAAREAAAREAAARGEAPVRRPCAFCQDRRSSAQCQCNVVCDDVPDCWLHPHRGYIGMPGAISWVVPVPRFR